MGLFIFILGLILSMIGLYGMFKKAAVTPWKALVPYYNTWVMVELMGTKRIWFFLQFIPIIGQVITLALTIDFVKQFGRFMLWQHALVVFAPFAYLPYLGYNKATRYGGRELVKKYKKSVVREWVDAAVFAVVAATIIRTFVFEAYTIPTPSMEKTLLVNDYLFVSKLSYGPRLPNTPLSFPFVHNTMPLFNTKSYLEWVHWPYMRIFSSPVRRKDVVVFNFPVGDTVINAEGYQSERTYYEICRAYGRANVLDDPLDFPLVIRPVDKQENFIKRCTGIAGDTLSVVHGVVYIDGVAQDLPTESEMIYDIVTNGTPILEDYIHDTLGFDLDGAEYMGSFNFDDSSGNRFQYSDSFVRLNLTPWMLKKVRALPNVKSAKLEEESDPDDHVFPYDLAHHAWSRDDYGPVWIPKKGATVHLTPDNIALYRRVISVYEGNKLEQNGSQFTINGVRTDSYTFKMNYYWMMGDNRHNSLDSRYWGFVPEDHVVGKASFIWMSYNRGVRWRRIFQIIR